MGPFPPHGWGHDRSVNAPRIVAHRGALSTLQATSCGSGPWERVSGLLAGS